MRLSTCRFDYYPALASTLIASCAAVAQTRPAAPAQPKMITISEGTDMAATVSPDQKTIIMDLQGLLYSLPIAGGKAKQISTPYDEDSHPAWSPKHDVVAIQSYAGGTFHIWTILPDGRQRKQITKGHGDDREPSISPDGTTIAFASDRAFKGSYDIWTVDIATGALKQITSNEADEFGPSWSPDGAQIAFVQNIGDKRLLRVMSVRDGKLAGGVDLDGQRMRRLEWADNKNLLITTSYSGAPSMVVTQLIGEVRELTLLNTATHKYLVLPNWKQASYATRSVEIGRYQVRRLNGRTELFLALREGIVRIDLDSGARQVVWRTYYNDLGYNWVVGTNGHVAAFETNDPAQQRWTLRGHVNGALHPIASGTGFIDTTFEGYGPNADSELIEQLQDGNPTWRLRCKISTGNV